MTPRPPSYAYAMALLEHGHVAGRTLITSDRPGPPCPACGLDFFTGDRVYRIAFVRNMHERCVNA